MSLDAYSRIVIRRPGGAVEVIGRKGHLDPHAMARDMAMHGEVLAVRHETMPAGAKRAQLVAIHKLQD